MSARRSTRFASDRRPARSLGGLPAGPVLTSCAVAELEVRDSGILLLLDGTESSWIDLADPAHLDFEYQQQMDAALTALLPEPTPVHALHLGGAGCALARAWEARRPGSSQTAVEIDELLATYVRQWFDLPRSPRLRIRVGDAAQVLASGRDGVWDVVVRDVFAAGSVPESCRTQEFHAHAARVLAPDGLYLANLSSRPRQVAGEDLAAVREAFGGVLVVADPAVVRGRRHGNLVVVARRQPWSAGEQQGIDAAVRRLPLPVRAWRASDPALPQA